MNCPDIISSAVRSLVSCQPAQRDSKGYIITTPCLYPVGSSVQIMVKEVENGNYYVNDGGRALIQIRSSHHQTKHYGQHLSRAAGVFGVSYGRGLVFMKGVSASSLDAAITLVANASSHGVALTMEHYVAKKTENFRFAFDSYIRESFADKFRPELFDGAHRSHHLNYVYRADTLVITDPLQADRMSVDKAFTDFYDILHASRRPDSLVLVYDRSDRWRDGDLDQFKSLGEGVMVTEYEEARILLPQLVPTASSTLTH